MLVQASWELGSGPVTPVSLADCHYQAQGPVGAHEGRALVLFAEGAAGDSELTSLPRSPALSGSLHAKCLSPAERARGRGGALVSSLPVAG